LAFVLNAYAVEDKTAVTTKLTCSRPLFGQIIHTIGSNYTPTSLCCPGCFDATEITEAPLV